MLTLPEAVEDKTIQTKNPNLCSQFGAVKPHTGKGFAKTKCLRNVVYDATPQNNLRAPHIHPIALRLWGHSSVEPHSSQPSSPPSVYAIDYIQCVVLGSHILLLGGLAALPNTTLGDDSASSKQSQCAGCGLIGASFVLLATVGFLHLLHRAVMFCTLQHPYALKPFVCVVARLARK